MSTSTLMDDVDRTLASRWSSTDAWPRGTLMRCALGLVFLWFGAMKFTGYEATGIAPFVANSPLMGWMHATLGIQGASNAIGVLELVTGVLLLAGFAMPRLGIAGGAMATATFAITLTFLFTTPGVGEPLAGGFPALSAAPGQFLLKDVGLLAIAVFLLGESMERIRSDGQTDRPAIDARVRAAGGALLRYGMALIFLWFGAMKFTGYEATGIAGFVANSPLLVWLHALFGVQGASNVLGVFEVATGLLLLLGDVSSRVRIAGAAMAVLTFAVTVTLLVTTPGVVAPAGFPVLSGDIGQFLLKDVGLLAISIALLREALRRRAIVEQPVRPAAWNPQAA